GRVGKWPCGPEGAWCKMPWRSESHVVGRLRFRNGTRFARSGIAPGHYFWDHVMADNKGRRRVTLGVEVLETRAAPSASPWLTESFDGTAAGGLPAGWSQWSSTGGAPFGVSPARSFTGPNGLAATATKSTMAARAWLNAVLPPDGQASADVFVNTAIPSQVFVRGVNLDTPTPSYYALGV